MPQLPALGLTWTLSTLSGYGIYGLQIILQYFRRGGEKVVPTHAPGPVLLPALTQRRLMPLLQAAEKVAVLLANNPTETLTFNHPVLYAIGNDGKGFEGQDRIRGSFNVGCAAIEHLAFSPHGIEMLQSYDCLIAISRWNERFLQAQNVAPVHLCFQGIDTTLFNVGPASGLFANRFVVFSGGKFEFRKGQDIVVAAFKRFQQKHPEALLVTSWQSLLPLDPAPFLLAGNIQTLPEKDATQLHVTPWLLSQGLPPGSFVDLPPTPNMLMPSVLRECDIAVFPNRCEGGTNLVAMEAMACGVPTYVAANTGQQDLIDLLGAGALGDQRPVKDAPSMADCTDGWGETDADAVFEAMESVYTHRDAARATALATAERIKNWDWGLQNEKLLKIVFQEA